MLTVVVGLESSGTSSTCRPLASRYSVMPSTALTWLTPAGRPCAELVWMNRAAVTPTATDRIRCNMGKGTLRRGNGQCRAPALAPGSARGSDFTVLDTAPVRPMLDLPFRDLVR